MIFIIIIFCLVFMFLSKNKRKNNLDNNDLEREMFENFTDGNTDKGIKNAVDAGEKALAEENKVEMQGIKSEMKKLTKLEKAALAEAKKNINSQKNMSKEQKKAEMIAQVKVIANQAEQSRKFQEDMKKAETEAKTRGCKSNNEEKINEYNKHYKPKNNEELLKIIMKYHEDQYIKLFGEDQIFKNKASKNPSDKYKASYINFVLTEKVFPNKNHTSRKLQSISSILGEIDEPTRNKIIDTLFKQVIVDNVRFTNRDDFDSYIQIFNKYVCKVKAETDKTLKCKTDNELKNQCRYGNDVTMQQIEILVSEIKMEYTELKSKNDKIGKIIKF